jgi:hypothetical protein
MMIKYSFHRTIEIIVFFLFLINVIIGDAYLLLSYLKKIELSQTNFIILFIYLFLTTFTLGEILLKRWYNENKENKKS